MNNRVFNPSDIKHLDYSELDGKVLKMIVINNVDGLLIAGQDVKEKKVYILNVKPNNEEE